MKCFLLSLFLFLNCKLIAQFNVHFIVDEASSPVTHQIFITGSFNNWDPGDFKYKLASLDGGPTSIVLNLPAGKCEYKFTRGSWSTVERDMECREIESRGIQIRGDTTITILIEQWKDKCLYEDTSIVSIQQALQMQKIDTFKVALLNRLSTLALIKIEIPLAYQYAREAYTLAEKINYTRGKARATSVTGNIHYAERNYAEARKSYLAALELYKGLKSTLHSAYIIERIGWSHFNEWRYDEAMKYWYECLRMYEMLSDETSIARCRSGIAEVLWRLNNDADGLTKFKEAAKSFEESWALHKESWMRTAMANCYISIAKTNLHQDKYGEAMYYGSMALEIHQEMKDDLGLSMAFSTMGNIKVKEGEAAQRNGDKTTLEVKHSEALKLYNESIVRTGFPEAFIGAGKLYTAQKNLKEAKRYLETGLLNSQLWYTKEYLAASYQAMAVLDSASGNFQQAFENYKKYVYHRDKLMNEESARKSDNYRLQYEFEKKEAEVKLLTTENKLTAAIAAKEKQQKRFAYAGIVALFVIGGFAFNRFRLFKNLKNKQALTNERLRISRDLHDEVGATLSGISMYTHIAKEQIKSENRDVVLQSLNVMHDSAGDMVAKLSDIVWLLKPDQAQLRQLMDKLELYARDMGQAKGIQVDMNITDGISQIELPLEVRRNIYLFCKEAINNSVKYSEGNIIDLNVVRSDHTLEFGIWDNGKGFNPETVKRGNGLNNMQKRADEIGATFIMESALNMGTKLLFQYKLN